MEDIEEYQLEITEDIRETVGSKPVQPILFVGSGLSKRYFSGPSWDGLLSNLAASCPKLEYNYGYYRQSRDPPEMGSLLADRFSQWAWDQNERKFSDMKPDYEQNPDIFLKKEISDRFKELTPETVDELTEEKLDEDLTIEDAANEIDLLRDIQPHAVITTNYDTFLETIFNNDGKEDEKYDVIVGEKILRAPHKSVGEILKIHGSVTQPESLILTSEDYDEFVNRKRYLSSKMLTYFAEHPLLIVGYSATDPNVRSILSWVNQLLPGDEMVAEDIYFLNFCRNIEELDEYSLRKRIPLGEERYISVKQIMAKDFGWVFEAFASGEGFEVDIRYLRKLLANTYEVVRSKSSRERVVDHQRLEEVAEDQGELATVLGISAEERDRGFLFDHDLSPSDLYDETGLGSAHKFKEKVLVPIYQDSGVNITGFKNSYHIAFWNEGESPDYRRYSSAAVGLCNRVMEGEEYNLNIPESRINEDHMERGLDLSPFID
ncbi:SIR2 family protein [Natrarchaeobaculum aegyptiacum]|uniref:Uncharacterized protein n=1 Tax=Natrarchaeobaculum aegyptiacum TaxID=745377 RepID=A0A2Z2HT82_9EURY|nr:SIR2 family protein [Natrarchaeobaculum aegyptiacum]ARS89325.1 hypothetical protein B1756_05905 [Natrarchaeobaculum aegyptiacum]